MIVEYARVRESAKHPERANPSDAGLDVFFCPEFDQEVVLESGESALFDSGLKFAIPHGYMLQVMNRSSVAAKRGLIVGAHCIDSGYEGEVFIDLHNVSHVTQVVASGEKIAQLVMIPVINFRAQETDEDELYEEPMTISNRGFGALGSTDNTLFPLDDNQFDFDDETWTR